MLLSSLKDDDVMPFSEFQDLALNHPVGGFYASSGGAGRGGDFITSPEVGPLFGAVIAAALDRWWDELGQPNPFTVVEAGAGTGMLALSIAQAEPECLRVLDYITVEKSDVLRSRQAERLSVKNIRDLHRGPDAARSPIQITALGELPSTPFKGVILANELLDNLPVDLVERQEGLWYRVGVQKSSYGTLREALIPMPTGSGMAKAAQHFGEKAEDGDRFALQGAAQDWVRIATGLITEGRVVAIDYATTTNEMLEQSMDQWLRTFRSNRAGGDPLDQPGTQDITCDVATDQLDFIAPISKNTSQADFLRDHGLSQMLSDARRTWHGRSDIGDLTALRARSRVQEGRVLTSEPGLGAHRVLEWIKEPERARDAPPIQTF